MALFQHPCLVRGIVHTPHGAFEVVRRLVDLSDEIGKALGWEPVDVASSPASKPVARALIASPSAAMDQRDAN